MKKLLILLSLTILSLNTYSQQAPNNYESDLAVRKFEFKTNLKESGASLKASQQCMLTGICLIGLGAILSTNTEKYNNLGSYTIAGGFAFIFVSHIYIHRAGNKLKEASEKF
jgi:hypothetical protein